MNVKKFAIIGYHLSHSMSPIIHKRLFDLSNNQTCEYEIIEISPDMLEKKIDILKNLDGFNVTIPHKVNIIKHINTLDEKASIYNSVNVVDCKDKNNILGYNTDVFGFNRSIDLLNTSLKNSNVLLLGVGGVGRMMAIETCIQGGKLTIAVRNTDLHLFDNIKNEVLSQNKNASINSVDINKICGNYDILINATPVGMYPNNNNCPISEDVIKTCKYIFDCIYNPVETNLIKLAKKNNINVLGGMPMFVYQAVKSHEIWFNLKFNDKNIENLISDMDNFVKENFN